MTAANAGRASVCIVRALMVVLVLTAASTQARAQDGAETSEGLHLGSLNLSPVVRWRSEYDDNIFHNAQPVSDTVSTLEGDTKLRGQVRRVGLTASGSAAWVHYNKLSYLGGTNLGGSLKLDFLFNRVVPYVSTSYSSSDRRQNPEIDTLPRFKTSSLAAGSVIRFGGKTTMDLSASRTNHDYASIEEFDGVGPYTTLNRESQHLALSFAQEVTTLTRLTVTGEMRQDRFDSSVNRDADYTRLTAGFESDGVVKGYARAGTRLYKPHDQDLPDSRGLFVQVGTSTTLFDKLGIRINADRDVAPSYRTEASYYESYGYGVTASYAVRRPLKISMNVGRRFADYSYADTYSPSASAPLGMEFYKTYGSDVSYQVGTALTIHVSGTYQERESSQASRQFEGVTLLAGVSHAF